MPENNEREIKFRVWDNYNRLFVDPLLFNIRADNGKVQNNDCPGIIGGVTVTQWVGLKDKNGKDIYEGDVINGDTTVVWNENFASFALRRTDWVFDHFFGEAIDPNDCEVTGNIYQITDHPPP